MRIAYVQTEPRIGQTKENLDRAIDMIERVKDADLVVLPELFHSGYKFESRDEAESLSCEIPAGDPVQALLYAARKWDMHIAAGVLERQGSLLFNSAVLVNSDDVVLKYRKIHLFNTEKEIFKPGDKPPKVADVNGAKVGLLICFDWIFPGVWHYLAREGAQIICHPANLVLPGKCERGVIVRAMENRIFVITSDRVGEERGLEFIGTSQIVDPGGDVLSKAPEKGEYADMVTINPELALDKWITTRNHVIDDARWELYPPPEEDEEK